MSVPNRTENFETLVSVKEAGGEGGFADKAVCAGLEDGAKASPPLHELGARQARAVVARLVRQPHRCVVSAGDDHKVPPS